MHSDVQKQLIGEIFLEQQMKAFQELIEHEPERAASLKKDFDISIQATAEIFGKPVADPEENPFDALKERLLPGNEWFAHVWGILSEIWCGGFSEEESSNHLAIFDAALRRRILGNDIN
jgi:hypothetical protein